MADSEIKPVRRVLSNSAAEFVENRAGRAVIAETVGEASLTDQNDPEFANELDRFVPPDQRQKYRTVTMLMASWRIFDSVAGEYSLSAEKSQKFQATLAQFCNSLKKRKL